MKRAAQIVSALALAATILAPLLFYAGRLSLSETKTWMLISTLVWYASAPLWMRIKPTE